MAPKAMHETLSEQLPLYKDPNVLTAKYMTGFFAVLAAAGYLAYHPSKTDQGDIVGPKALAKAEITRFAYDAAHHQEMNLDLTIPREKYDSALLLDYHNLARSQADLGPLKESLALDTTAQARATYLAKLNALRHIKDWWVKPTQYLREEHPGISSGFVGENLAWSGTPGKLNQIVAMWLDSPEHYKNITDPRFTEVGFGEAITKHGREIIVVHFGGYKE